MSLCTCTAGDFLNKSLGICSGYLKMVKYSLLWKGRRICLLWISMSWKTGQNNWLILSSFYQTDKGTYTTQFSFGKQPWICQWERAQDSRHIHTLMNHTLRHTECEQKRRTAAAVGRDPCCLQVTALCCERSSYVPSHTAPDMLPLRHIPSSLRVLPSSPGNPSFNYAIYVPFCGCYKYFPFPQSNEEVEQFQVTSAVRAREAGTSAVSLTSSQGYLPCRWAKTCSSVMTPWSLCLAEDTPSS